MVSVKNKMKKTAASRKRERLRREAEERHEDRPAADQVVDEAQIADDVVPETQAGYVRWAKDPGRSDYPDIDTPAEPENREINRMGYIHPLSRHRLEYTDHIADGVPEMAGFGGHREGGHDALQGIDKMVMGEVNAMAEARVESSTQGGPLELGPYETIFEDSVGFGDMDPALPLTTEEDPAKFDWCGWL